MLGVAGVAARRAAGAVVAADPTVPGGAGGTTPRGRETFRTDTGRVAAILVPVDWAGADEPFVEAPATVDPRVAANTELPTTVIQESTAVANTRPHDRDDARRHELRTIRPSLKWPVTWTR